MYLLAILATVGTVLLTNWVACASPEQQHAFTSRPSSKEILSPDIKEYIDSVVKRDHIPGLSLAFVFADGRTEFGNWGVRGEDGDPMTSDVRHTAVRVASNGPLITH
jgi:CubicO group peptidase (beta-lactamase class C family)